MKVLNNRIFRGINKNKSFYISSIILTAIAVMIFLAEISAGYTVGTNYANFMQKNKIEDAQFTVINELNDSDIRSLEEEFSLEIEPQSYFDAEEEEFILRIFEETEKINLYQVTKGNDIEHQGEILISNNFAEANSYEIGDSIELQGNSYEICGFAERPDYLYMIRNSSDIFHSNSTFGLGIMMSEDLKKLGEATKIYSVKYNNIDDNENIINFRTKLYDDYHTLSYTSADNNIRITKPAEISESCYSSGYSMIAVMCLLVMVIISLILGRIVKKECKQIGTLSAFGYKKHEIKAHYMLYGIITGIAGSAVGFILSFATLNYLIKYSTSQLEYIEFDLKLDVTAVIICISLPMILYGITAYYTAGKLLSKNEVVELLANRFESNKKTQHKILKNNTKSIRFKFKLRTLIANKKRTIIAFVGLLLGSICILFGFSMNDTIHYFLNNGFDEMGSYNYQYFLSEVKYSDTEPVVNGEAMNVAAFELKENGKLLNIYGVDSESSLVNIKVDSDEVFDENNYYITAIAAKLYDVEVGDVISLNNPMSIENVEIEISGIINNNVTAGIYTGRGNVCKLLGVENETYYNIVVTEENAENEFSVYTIISKEMLKAQMNDAIKTLNSMIYMVIFFGVLICIIFVYICINQIITENLLNVSMFKVLGYRNKEINSMILTPYHIFVPVTLLLSIPISKVLSQSMWNMYASMYNFQAEAKLDILSICIAAAIFVISYALSLILLRRKVFHADMVEVLKDNRE